MNTDHALLLDIRQYPFHQTICDPTVLVHGIDRKIIDLKGPAVMEQHGCADYKSGYIAVNDTLKSVGGF